MYLVGALTLERVSGACFRSKRLRVYWLEYLPGSVFRKRVSGASSLVCTGLDMMREQNSAYFFARNRWCRRGSFAPGVCCRSVLQEQAPSCVPAFTA